MTKQIRINPRRWARLIEILQSGSSIGDATVVAHFDSWVLNLKTGETIDVIKILPGRVYASELTPAVQSLISRVPLSPAPDSQQSDADDSDTAQPQSGGGDSRCDDAQVSSSEEQSSSSAVGSSRSDAGKGAPSASDESNDSSDRNGQAQTDSESSSEDSEHRPGSQPDQSGASEQDGVQGDIQGADKAEPTGAPGGEEGTGRLARESAPSLPTGEVPAAGVVEAATENKGLNPFRISLRPKREHGGVFGSLSDADAQPSRALIHRARSVFARMLHGGVFGSLSDADAQPSRALIHRARSVFARMLHGGEGDPGARWRASRVAVKTAGYLRQWSVNDRRAENGRPAILILSDVSGSMSAYARDVLQFALAVSRIGLPGGEIAAVAHSNGYPEEVFEGGRVRHVTSLSVYQQIIARYDVRAVVIAADHDGEAIYRALYETTTARYYWLHAYCSRVAERVKIVRPCQGLWPEWARADRLRMAYGCGTAERALEAMERFLGGNL